MKEHTTVLPFSPSESVTDPLTELAREGAGRRLAEALKAQANEFVVSFAHEHLKDGRQQIVRHGYAVICVPVTMATSGQTASIFRRGWRKTLIVYW